MEKPSIDFCKKCENRDKRKQQELINILVITLNQVAEFFGIEGDDVVEKASKIRKKVRKPLFKEKHAKVSKMQK